MKLDPKKSYWEQDFGWVGHPEATPPPGTEDELLVSRRFDIEIHGGVMDKDACYSYDDFALCELDGKFYLLQTTGCSCPSPSETWRVVSSGTIDNIKAYVLDPLMSTYEVPFKQRAEFLAIIDGVMLEKRGKIE